jgi:hypothetical protein
MRSTARIALFTVTLAAAAQSPPELHFEVASVKIGGQDSSAYMSGGPGTGDPERIDYTTSNSGPSSSWHSTRFRFPKPGS